jgi:diaminohydroxyphosphoribosylaminopyrimidine deaminase / 5-amino-6-(5-phosphoribosylamino)uracil reductase
MTAAGFTAEQLMRRALSIAAHGPLTGGNPQVGCVLADSEGRIVAEGWHRGAGTPHAEVDALSKLPGASNPGASSPGAGARGTSSREEGNHSAHTTTTATGLTAYVTLEPCNHTGRTGPCSEALIAAGIERVVFAVADPGATSSGGADRLRAAGVAVDDAGGGGLLANEAEALILPWLTSVRRGTPWVTVKWAQSLDGRAAAADGTSQWITGTAARQRVHEQRAQNDAILVGTGTVLSDDPSLTARGDGGELLAHQPIPVVVGERAVPAHARLRSHPAGLIETGTRDLGTILASLDARGIRRVYVEGGPTIASAVIAAGLADEVLVFIAPVLIGGPGLAIGDLGVATIGEAPRLTVRSVEQLGDDLLVTARPTGFDTALRAYSTTASTASEGQ